MTSALVYTTAIYPLFYHSRTTAVGAACAEWAIYKKSSTAQTVTGYVCIISGHVSLEG